LNYIDIEQLEDPYENLRVVNLINDKVNQKAITSYEMLIDDTARPFPELAAIGAFIITISGIETGLPVGIYAVTKSANGVAGSISTLSSQAGTAAGTWAGNVLTVSSTASAFEVNHDRSESGNFNVTITGL